MAKVVDLTTKILDILHDENRRVFGEDQIHRWVNEAETVVAIHKPDSTSTNIDYQCTGGARQDLSGLTDPTIGLILVVHHNGPISAPGTYIHQVSRDNLGLIDPGWQAREPADQADEYIYDENEKQVIYLSPPAKAGNIVNLSVSAVPAEYGTVDETTETTVRDLYAPALVEWCMYRVFSEGDEGGVNAQRALSHLANCSNLLGVKLQNEIRTTAGRRNQSNS